MRIFSILLLCIGLGAGCAPNLSSAPARPGVVQERGATGNIQTVQFVVIPNDATCRLSGTAYDHGMQGSGLLSVPIKASPVTIHCSKRGHHPVKREVSSTLEEPGGLASEALTGGLFGFFKSVMIGKGQRYPPMVHMVLPHSRSNTASDETLAYNRQLIQANWKLLKRGREIECKGKNGTVETSIWSIHCDTARFKDYESDDLKAFDSASRK